jgi:preprotein translocase subunit SecE
MAVKEKVDVLDRKSRLLEVLAKDYKWETYLYMFVSLVLIILGLLILKNVITFKDSIPIVGTYPTPFAVVLVVIGTLSLIYSVYPFIKLAFPELKKTEWPRTNKFLGDVVRTFVFLILFTLVYLMFDVIISELLSRWFNL